MQTVEDEESKLEMQKTPNGNIDFERELGISPVRNTESPPARIDQIETDPFSLRMNSVTTSILRPKLLLNEGT